MIFCKYRFKFPKLKSNYNDTKSICIRNFKRELHKSNDLLAGHSHWSNIVRHKAKMDLAKSKQFTKISQEIKMSVKLAKNGDPKENPRLAVALQKAKAINFPKEKIEEAINRGLGKFSGDVVDVTYELYGPNRVAMVLQVTTDNKNRSTQTIRHWANKYGGSMANNGTFDFLFQKTGIVQFKADLPEDKIMELAINSGAEDFEKLEDGTIQIICSPDEDVIWRVKEYVEEHGIEVLEANVVNIPLTKVHLNEEEQNKFEEALNQLYEMEPDIQDLYHNAEFEEQS